MDQAARRGIQHACTGVDDAAAPQSREIEHAANDVCSGPGPCTDAVFANATNVTYANCMITSGHTAQLQIQRINRGAVTWQGFVESTFNQ